MTKALPAGAACEPSCLAGAAKGDLPRRLGWTGRSHVPHPLRHRTQKSHGFHGFLCAIIVSMPFGIPVAVVSGCIPLCPVRSGTCFSVDALKLEMAMPVADSDRLKLQLRRLPARQTYQAGSVRACVRRAGESRSTCRDRYDHALLSIRRVRSHGVVRTRRSWSAV